MTKIAENMERGLSLAERNKIARVQIRTIRATRDMRRLPAPFVHGLWVIENGRKVFAIWSARKAHDKTVFDRVA